MSGFYTEADYENSVMELFSGLNYDIVYGPDVERNQRSPLYDEVLEDYIRRLNSDLPEDAIADALYKLRNFESGELAQRNEVFMDYLQSGIPVRYTVNGEERSAIASTSHATVTDGKGGVFWHTQGSGKSLSMVFYVHLLQSALNMITGNLLMALIWKGQRPLPAL